MVQVLEAQNSGLQGQTRMLDGMERRSLLSLEDIEWHYCSGRRLKAWISVSVHRIGMRAYIESAFLQRGLTKPGLQPPWDRFSGISNHDFGPRCRICTQDVTHLWCCSNVSAAGWTRRGEEVCALMLLGTTKSDEKWGRCACSRHVCSTLAAWRHSVVDCSSVALISSFPWGWIGCRRDFAYV